MTKIDWEGHVSAFRASAQSAADYCTGAGIKLQTFRYHLYRQNAQSRRKPKDFEEFQVATELVISRDRHGALSLRGIDASHLPQIVGAWFDALS